VLCFLAPLCYFYNISSSRKNIRGEVSFSRNAGKYQLLGLQALPFQQRNPIFLNEPRKDVNELQAQYSEANYQMAFPNNQDPLSPGELSDLDSIYQYLQQPELMGYYYPQYQSAYYPQNPYMMPQQFFPTPQQYFPNQFQAQQLLTAQYPDINAQILASQYPELSAPAMDASQLVSPPTFDPRLQGMYFNPYWPADAPTNSLPSSLGLMDPAKQVDSSQSILESAKQVDEKLKIVSAIDTLENEVIGSATPTDSSPQSIGVNSVLKQQLVDILQNALKEQLGEVSNSPEVLENSTENVVSAINLHSDDLSESPDVDNSDDLVNAHDSVAEGDIPKSLPEGVIISNVYIAKKTDLDHPAINSILETIQNSIDEQSPQFELFLVSKIQEMAINGQLAGLSISVEYVGRNAIITFTDKPEGEPSMTFSFNDPSSPHPQSLSAESSSQQISSETEQNMSTPESSILQDATPTPVAPAPAAPAAVAPATATASVAQQLADLPSPQETHLQEALVAQEGKHHASKIVSRLTEDGTTEGSTSVGSQQLPISLPEQHVSLPAPEPFQQNEHFEQFPQQVTPPSQYPEPQPFQQNEHFEQFPQQLTPARQFPEPQQVQTPQTTQHSVLSNEQEPQLAQTPQSTQHSVLSNEPPYPMASDSQIHQLQETVSHTFSHNPLQTLGFGTEDQSSYIAQQIAEAQQQGTFEPFDGSRENHHIEKTLDRQNEALAAEEEGILPGIGVFTPSHASANFQSNTNQAPNPNVYGSAGGLMPPISHTMSNTLTQPAQNPMVQPASNQIVQQAPNPYAQQQTNPSFQGGNPLFSGNPIFQPQEPTNPSVPNPLSTPSQMSQTDSPPSHTTTVAPPAWGGTPSHASSMVANPPESNNRDSLREQVLQGLGSSTNGGEQQMDAIKDMLGLRRDTTPSALYALSPSDPAPVPETLSSVPVTNLYDMRANALVPVPVPAPAPVGGVAPLPSPTVGMLNAGTVPLPANAPEDATPVADKHHLAKLAARQQESPPDTAVSSVSAISGTPSVSAVAEPTFSSLVSPSLTPSSPEPALSAAVPPPITHGSMTVQNQPAEVPPNLDPFASEAQRLSALFATKGDERAFLSLAAKDTPPQRPAVSVVSGSTKSSKRFGG